MRNKSLKTILSGIFVLATLQAFGKGAESSITSGQSIWFLLSLIVLFVVIFLTFLLRRIQKKNSHKLKLMSDELKKQQEAIATMNQNHEEIVQQRAKELQKEVSTLKENIKSMKQTLETSKLSAHRNALLMTKISNTLRTNLNDILGFSTLMGNEFALNEETELFEYNENIRKSGAALMHLLNNIIDISKIESKSFSLNEEACNLTDITNRLIAQYKPVAEQKGVQIVYQDNSIPLFSADNQALTHILTNLLDNAVRYTDKGFIKISQFYNNENIVWTIKDTGMGIDKAYLPDIFEPFRQHSLGFSKTTYQGAGLGLPLIKSMLDIMGGHIEINSEKAAGTEVKVTLPFKAYIPKTTSSSKKTMKEGKKPAISKAALKKSNIHILVLNEDKLENMLLKRMFPEANVETYDQEMPPTEWLATRLDNRPLPDLIMVELDFSGKGNGYKILKDIRRKNPETNRIPAIALSAYPDAFGPEKAKNAGFKAYVEKPFRKNDLISLINQFFSS